MPPPNPDRMKWPEGPPREVEEYAFRRARAHWEHFMRRQPPGVDPDAMWSAALEGVRKSYAYEADHGASYGTWLDNCVRHALQDGLRANDYLTRGQRERVRREGPSLPTDYAPLSLDTPTELDDGSEVDLSAQAASGQPGPLAQLLNEERKAYVHRALAALETAEAAILRLRYLDGETWVPTAAALGMSVKAAKNLEARAIAALVEYVETDPGNPLGVAGAIAWEENRDV